MSDVTQTQETILKAWATCCEGAPFSDRSDQDVENFALGPAALVPGYERDWNHLTMTERTLARLKDETL